MTPLASRLEALSAQGPPFLISEASRVEPRVGVLAFSAQFPLRVVHVFCRRLVIGKVLQFSTLRVAVLILATMLVIHFDVMAQREKYTRLLA